MPGAMGCLPLPYKFLQYGDNSRSLYKRQVKQDWALRESLVPFPLLPRVISWTVTYRRSRP
jgi:hypothetical protein